jgi:hypothetical protein
MYCYRFSLFCFVFEIYKLLFLLQECSNYPGFVTKFRVSNQFSEANDHVGYENYRHVCHKWHYKITKAMVVCLDSKDYVQIRNSLIILIKILPHFPVLAKLSQIIERKIEKVNCFCRFKFITALKMLTRRCTPKRHSSKYC